MYTTGTEFDDLTQKFPLKHIAVLSIVKSLEELQTGYGRHLV